MARRKSKTTARRRSSRESAKGFYTKVMIDVAGAGIATRLIPILVNSIYPLDPTLYTVVGAGGGYLAGRMLKRPLLSNASIALGVVEFVAPMLESIVGGGGSVSPAVLPAGVKTSVPVPIKKTGMVTTVDDFFTLNEYTNSPAVQSNSEFRNSY